MQKRLTGEGKREEGMVTLETLERQTDTERQEEEERWERRSKRANRGARGKRGKTRQTDKRASYALAGTLGCTPKSTWDRW